VRRRNWTAKRFLQYADALAQQRLRDAGFARGGDEARAAGNESNTGAGPATKACATSLARLLLPPIVDNRPTSPNPIANMSAVPAAIDRLPRATFRAHIADRLRAAILSGDLAPGTALVETALAARFSVSRAPLREALRQLIEEGLVVTVPYTGTRVVELSVEDVREIYSMRITLERFAFEEAWPRRDAAFTREMRRRKAALTTLIDKRDDLACIDAELDLHGLVYEASGHRLLQQTWAGLRGRLQLYWAAHHRAHGMRGPKRSGHDSYVAAALGDDLDAMRAEIEHHMRRGALQTERFLVARAANAAAP
jgi:DNA-binding GntR family transcriptional regulator